jgi:hypothetical protein
MNNTYIKYLLLKREGIKNFSYEISENLDDYVVSNHNANFLVSYIDNVWKNIRFFMI